ncbi:hypothetical protein HDU91_002468 [Kappamyces sp. JEL0680]|nr:hypothetical protein HDU91_002468 [Kappamyces sp. JEL0680]
MAAMWIRAAFHSAGTWEPDNKGSEGGAEGSIMKFLNNTAENKGLGDSIAGKFQQNPSVVMSNADMITLAAHVSVSHCGGPAMDFQSGRVDAASNFISPVGRLPPANASLASLKPRFKEMGWTNEDIVALVSGSHTMGGVHSFNSPELTNETFVPFDDTAGIFDNHVFQFTLNGHCPVPIDCEIARDPELRPIVQQYASDQNAFFAQYAKSFLKLNSQTLSQLSAPYSVNIPAHQGLYTTPQPPVNASGTAGGSNKNAATGYGGLAGLYGVLFIMLLT